MKSSIILVALASTLSVASAQQVFSPSDYSQTVQFGQSINTTELFKGSADNLSKPYTVTFDVSFEFEKNEFNPHGGFRAYNNQNGYSPYSLVWASNQEGGALTLFGDQQTKYAFKNSIFNISDIAKANTVDIKVGTFRFEIDVNPEVQKTGQVQGNYSVTVTHLGSNISETSDKLGFSSSFFNASNFGNFKTELQDDLRRTTLNIGQVSQTPVPEPSSALLAIAGLGTALLRRRR